MGTKTESRPAKQREVVESENVERMCPNRIIIAEGNYTLLFAIEEFF